MSSLFWTEGKRLKPLERVLRRWRKMIRDHPRRFRDTLVWNRERPQVGFLAAAAWLSGGAAIEQWGARKRGSDGRVDLYLEIDELRVVIEAKQEFLRVGTSKRDRARMKQALLRIHGRAAKAARRGPRGEGRLASAAFVCPYAWSKADLGPGQKKLRAALEELRRDVRVGFAAWAEATEKSWREESGERSYFAGMLLFGGIVAKRR